MALELDDFVHVWEGDLHITVRRGTPWAEIEARIATRRKWLDWQERRHHYHHTHKGPWADYGNRCLACGKSLLEIHNGRLVCE